MRNSLKTTKAFILGIALAVGGSYAYATWSGPEAPPTGSNTEAPINVSDSLQQKEGSLVLEGGFRAFMQGIFDDVVTIGTTEPSTGDAPDGQSLTLDVEGAVGATHYCDENGDNCVAGGEIGTGGGDNSWPEGNYCIIQAQNSSCPSGFDLTSSKANGIGWHTPIAAGDYSHHDSSRQKVADSSGGTYEATKWAFCCRISDAPELPASIVTNVNSVTVTAGSSYNRAPSINNINKITTASGVTGIGFDGEYKINDKDATAWIKGLIPVIFKDAAVAEILSFSYKGSVWSQDDIGNVASWVGDVDFSYNISSNNLAWFGDLSGSTDITLGDWITLTDYSTKPHHDNCKAQYSLRVKVEKAADDYIVTIEQKSKARGEQYDSAHARVDYAMVHNLTME